MTSKYNINDKLYFLTENPEERGDISVRAGIVRGILLMKVGNFYILDCEYPTTETVKEEFLFDGKMEMSKLFSENIRRSIGKLDKELEPNETPDQGIQEIANAFAALDKEEEDLPF